MARKVWLVSRRSRGDHVATTPQPLVDDAASPGGTAARAALSIAR